MIIGIIRCIAPNTVHNKSLHDITTQFKTMHYKTHKNRTLHCTTMHRPMPIIEHLGLKVYLTASVVKKQDNSANVRTLKNKTMHIKAVK